MKLEHAFTVPVPVDEAWRVLRDVQRIAPCMPGATVDSVDGEEFSGRVKVKVGPITVTYRGEARFAEVDEQAHAATIEASGKEARGSGTARATVTARLSAEGEQTAVALTTDLTVTGKPAQFGRGVMADVGSKLIGEFAECLSAELGKKAAPPAPAAETAPAPAEPVAEVEEAEQAPPSPPRPTAESIDLFDVAGAPVARRLLPIAAALAVLAVIVWLIRRRA